jgi:UPF0755 protein
VLVLAAATGAALLFYGRSVYDSPGPLAKERIVTIPRGMRAPDIAAALESNGVISDGNIFLAAAYLTQNFKRMKAGEYQFRDHASMREVMELIVSGREFLHKITLPEGWTTAQLVDRLNALTELSGTIPDELGEGVLLPATYGFRRGAERTEILTAMRKAQDETLDGLWSQRAPGLPLETKQEALILASIVEKETAVPEERARIAAVFLNRLKKGMRLQSDPTVVYGITLGRRKLDRPILKEDLDAKNAYNTDQIAGLPPTPIANPGRESIAAVLNPADTGELYFVADGSGGHVFAKTLDEHNRNVAKWRVIERVERTEAEAASASSEEAASQPAPVMPQALPQAPVASIESTEATPSTMTPEPVEAPEATTPPDSGPSASESGEFEPGSVVWVAGKLIAIPAPRPKLQ